MLTTEQILSRDGYAIDPAKQARNLANFGPGLEGLSSYLGASSLAAGSVARATACEAKPRQPKAISSETPEQKRQRKCAEWTPERKARQSALMVERLAARGLCPKPKSLYQRERRARMKAAKVASAAERRQRMELAAIESMEYRARQTAA